MDWLDEIGVAYEEMDARQDAEITTVPVTEIDGERVVGFDRPAIKKLIKKAAKMAG